MAGARKGRPRSRRLEFAYEKPKRRKRSTHAHPTTVTQNSVRITVPHYGLKLLCEVTVNFNIC